MCANLALISTERRRPTRASVVNALAKRWNDFRAELWNSIKNCLVTFQSISDEHLNLFIYFFLLGGGGVLADLFFTWLSRSKGEGQTCHLSSLLKNWLLVS